MAAVNIITTDLIDFREEFYIFISIICFVTPMHTCQNRHVGSESNVCAARDVKQPSRLCGKAGRAESIYIRL